MIVIHIVMCILDSILYILATVLYYDPHASGTIDDARAYTVLVIYAAGAVWLLGFSLWFFYVAHWVQKQTKVRKRAIQFASITLSQSLLFLLEFIYRLIIELDDDAIPYRFDTFVTIQLIQFTIYAIRSLVCLTALGIVWPKTSGEPKKTIKTSRDTDSSWNTRVWQQLLSAFHRGNGQTGTSVQSGRTNTTIDTHQLDSTAVKRYNVLDEETMLDSKARASSLNEMR